ncbi:membrane dipeptidase [Novosphingobium sp.]|uniref:dipeptidase n=1 Tax=Novosphingobium sp. TaxID=1874826 RepID=UPI00286CB8AA|nr:membrane dipeptidase [Novosphingobium sp.]
MRMTRRAALAGAMAAPAAAALAKPQAAPSKPYRAMLVVDGLGGLSDPYSPEETLKLSPRAIAEMKASGVSVIDVTVGTVGNAPGGWEALLESIAAYDKLIAANADFLMPVRSLADFSLAKARGRLGIYYGTQDTSMIGTQLERLAELKTKGVRQVQLTYNLRNLSGDGALEPANAGLSRLGLKTIAAIEAQAMVLDLSHGGARTMAEAVAAAKNPPLISHTGCRALFDHPRNTADETMRAAADKGGCVGIYFMPFLAPGSKPTGAQLIDHIVHAANVCGEDHVSIGTDGAVLPIVIDDAARAAARADWDARSKAGYAAPGEGPDVFTIVADYNSIDKFARLAAALGKRGWTSRQVEKLLGGNLVRLFAEVGGTEQCKGT